MNWSPGQYLQLILIVLVLGFGAVSWIIKWLRQQSAIKQAQSQRQRRFEESLRTGRIEPEKSGHPAPGAPPITVSHADARQRLQELAQRRQRQLEELRRRQQGGVGGSPVIQSAPAAPPPAARPPQPVLVFGPTGPTLRPAPTARPGAQRPQPQPAPTPRPARQPQSRQAAKQQRKRAAAAQAALEAEAREAEAVHRLVRDSAAETAEARPGGPTGRRPSPLALGLPRAGAGPEEWRRAILMREILGTPVSLRKPTDPAGT
jgi:hypothetical protein